MTNEPMERPITCMSPLAGDAPALMRIVDRIKGIAGERVPTRSAAIQAIAGDS